MYDSKAHIFILNNGNFLKVSGNVKKSQYFHLNFDIFDIKPGFHRDWVIYPPEDEETKLLLKEILAKIKGWKFR